MTPAEKANKLFGKYYFNIEHTLSEEYSPHERLICKQCALIAVNEIMNIIDAEDHVILYNYWQQVKNEIENL